MSRSTLRGAGRLARGSFVLLVALVLIVARGHAQAAISYVQSTYAVPQTPTAVVAVKYVAAQVAGDLNVVVVGWNDVTSHITSVADSSGNVYALAVGPTIQPGIQTQAIYYARNIVAAAANTNTVTVTFDAPADYPDVRIAEYRGLDLVNPFDVGAGASGTATTSNSGNVTTTSANALLIGANYVQTHTNTAGSGYTSRLITSPDGNILEDRIVTAVGTYSATASVAGSGWVMQIAAFRAPSTGGDTQAPSAPAGLTATAASSTQINLSWTASTDNVGVTGYRIERCQGASCSTFAQVGTTTTAVTYSDTGLTASTSYSYRVRATDAAGNLGAYSNTSSATTQTPSDTQAPTAPATLTATAASSSRIDLSWAASTDNVGVTQYRIERCQGASCSNFAQVGTTTTATTYSDTGLAGSTSYTYRVRAGDLAGNLGGYSPTATATTPTAPDTQAPTAPGGLAATAASTTQINLTWTASTDNVGVTGYAIERCQGAGCSNFAQVGTTTTATTYSDTGLIASTSYSYRVRANDLAGNLSGYSTVATATTQAAPDTQAPTAPSNLAATAASSVQINLTWTASTDNVGVTAYAIERCQGAGCATFAQVGTTGGTTYNDVGLAASTSYTYRVRASDAANNQSAYSSTATATTSATPPPAIGFVQATYAVPQTPTSVVTVRYAGVQTAGNLNVVAIGWNDATAHVTAVTDSSGNSYAVAAGPTVQPGVQSGVIYYARNIAPAAANTNTVTVTFDSAADFPDVRIAEYRGLDPVNPLDVAVGAFGTATASSSGTATTTNANDLLVGANYVQQHTNSAGTNFTQRLLTSPDGNIFEDRIVTTAGTYSATAQVAGGGWVMQMAAFRGASGGGGGDTQAPSAPATLTATPASATQINLSWAASTDNVGVTGYQIERCQGTGCTTFAQVGTTTTATTFNNTGLTASTPYSYRVRATDAAGNLGAYSPTASATTPAAGDTQAPSAPSNLTATAVSSTQINLAWNASTDNVGVTGYAVERCQGASCSNFAQIGTTTTATTYNDTGRTASTTYRYRVRANDAAGNLSAYSAIANATTPAQPDTQAPTAPTNPAANAVSNAQITVSWTAATDNVGVTGYRIERCQGAGCSNFAQVGTATTTTYPDAGLAAGTSYSYRVRATDAAGNLGPYSTVVSATTLTGSTPVGYVQGTYAVPQTPQTVVTARYPGTQVAGNLNVVVIGWNNATAQVTSVTDTSGNVYAIAAGPTVQPGVQSQVIYYAAAIAPSASNTVTVRFDQQADYPDLRIAEYRGLDLQTPLDIGGGAYGTTATSDSGSVITTWPNDLLVGANYTQTHTNAAGAGYTQRILTSPNGSILEDRVVSASGAYNATAPVAGGGWVMQIAAFRAASGTPGDTQPPTVPGNLAASATGDGQITLTWTASTDDTVVPSYRIERCQGAGCGTFSQVAATGNTTYVDSGLLANTTYSYRVRATDGVNFSGYAGPVSATTPPPSALSVTITTPGAGANLTGTVTFMANATGTNVRGVQFQIDGLNVGPALTTAPFSLAFDTSQLANGAHQIGAYTWNATRTVANAAPVDVTFSNTNPGTPATKGLWSGLFTWPLVTVHVNLLSDGRVLAWDKMDTGNPDPVIWDPLTSSFLTVPTNDGANLFCAGHISLADGRLFSAGGHINDHVGLAAGKIFNPASNTWMSTPDMTYGRWYPTLTKLSDGKIFTIAGEVNCQNCDAPIAEIYDPATNTWTTMPEAPNALPYYPHVFLLSSGRLLVTGSAEDPLPAQVLDLTTRTWSVIDNRLFDAYSSVMYRQDKVLKSGTSTDTISGVVNSSATAYVLDMTLANPRWRQVASMAFPRAYHVLTSLPDGTVLVTGGGRTTGDYDIPNAVYAAEVWNPTTETWTTLSSMHAPRLYHGTALLLPDARVLISGGGRSPGPDSRDQLNAEIFAPPYLFKGPRPVITSAPQNLTYGQVFTVQTPDAARIASVSLIAIGSMTHGINMNQRYLPLPFTAGTGSLSVTAPANAILAPPGHYMLFLVDTNGVPSVSSIVVF